MRKQVLGLFIILFSSYTFGQNLVVNPSFENNTGCPVGTSQFTLVNNWTEPNAATTDYYHSCSPMGPMGAGVPRNLIGTQAAHSGSAYAGIVVYDDIPFPGPFPLPSADRWREYVQGELSQPLTAGQTYCVEFYISLADTVKFAITEMGVALVNNQVNDPDSTVLSGVTPDITFTSGLNDAANWVKMSGQFVASGGEQYVIIGNFNGPSSTNTVNSSSPNPSQLPPTGSYYYIDDVYVGICCDIFFDASITDETCTNSDGAIDLTITGGSGNYSYSWSNSMSTEDISGLTAGSYTVTVTDNTAGCSKDTTIVVGNNSTGCCVINLAATVTDENCGASDGAIDLTVTGGSGNYSYSWSNSMSTEDITGLSAGSYTVTVTDNTAGCSNDTTIVVAAIGTNCCSLTLDSSQTTITMATCGNADGSITGVTSSDNSATFIWIDAVSQSVVGNSLDLNNVSFGVYYLIANIGSCADTLGPFNVNNTNGPKISEAGLAIQNVGCGNPTGSISGLTISQGTSPYTYQWLNDLGNVVGTSLDLTGVPAGNYLLVVTDASGCQVTSSVFPITEFATFTINSNISDPSCNANDGSIAVSVAGGKAPYTYQWAAPGNGTEPAPGSSLQTNLGEGTYCVTVIDDNNCQSDTCITLASPNGVNASFVVSDSVFVIPETDIMLTDQSSTNVTSRKWYIYHGGVVIDSIVGNATNPIFTLPDSAGLYYIQLVVSGGGCSGDTILSVIVNHAEETIFVPNTFTPNGDGFNELFNPYTLSLAEYKLEIFDRWGVKLFETTDGNDAWDGKYQGQVCPDGVYVWKITYESFVSVETKVKYGHVILLK